MAGLRIKDGLMRAVTLLHRAVLRASRGRVGWRLSGLPMLLLATRGRITGKRRVTPLGYIEDGDRLVLVASYGGDPRHPKWYRNLCAHPEVEVRRSGGAGGGVEPMTARTATAEEKARLWPKVVVAYAGYQRYQERTDRDIPLVILTARG